MARHLESGRTAERIARGFLEARGLRWRESNYRCRYGEIDLVMIGRGVLVVAEIRYRRDAEFMRPAESVSRAKRTRIVKTALHLLQNRDEYRDYPLRFDVLSICGPLRRPSIDWIAGAFTAEDTGVS